MFSSRFQELGDVVAKCSYSTKAEALSETAAFKYFKDKLAATKAHGGIVYVIGNGGSAGIASHFSNDLIKALQIPSQTLFDSNLMTCLSNDLGYDQVFSYPLKQLLKSEDLLIAISSSGKSQNILNAAQVSIAHKTPLITLSGFLADNPLRTMGGLNFWIDSCNYGLVEVAHFFLLHTLIDLFHKHPSLEMRQEYAAKN
jgi:D-sedoheptulose 7-phosphate isomerase